jgi:AcrR family transcriptional regulator
VREAIVSTVVAMIDEHGWEHITVRRIGDRMHYAASTIVYHVGSLEELTMSARSRVATQIVEALFGPDAAPVAGAAADLEGYAAAAERVLTWIRDHPHLLAFFALKAPSDESLHLVNTSVPTTFAPVGRGWPNVRTLRYFDRALQCALEGALLLDDCPVRQREFLTTELAHLDAQWRRLVMTT